MDQLLDGRTAELQTLQVERGRQLRRPYRCLHHATKALARVIARATTIQFWNVTPSSVKCSASQSPTPGLPPTLKSYEKAILGEVRADANLRRAHKLKPEMTVQSAAADWS